jgi:hypothetical protein
VSDHEVPSDVRYRAETIPLYLFEASTITSVGSLFGLHISALCRLSNKIIMEWDSQYYEITHNMYGFLCVF